MLYILYLFVVQYIIIINNLLVINHLRSTVNMKNNFTVKREKDKLSSCVCECRIFRTENFLRNTFI